MNHPFIPRSLEKPLRKQLSSFPVVALIGPRQCGKSTLAKKIIREKKAVYLDLEMPSDLNKLTDAEGFLRANQGRLVCLDEIQRQPDLFPLLRALCDITRKPGQYLVLGSSSPELLRQSSETLAGRIAYLDLTPFTVSEVTGFGDDRTLWMRGGFPDSFLADSETSSFEWRAQFIRTFLERDMALFGFDFSQTTMRRLWTMLAHCNGQLLNAAKLSDSLGVSPPTVRRYIDFLEHTYMLRVLRPWFKNVKKRLVKSPKILFADTGLLHSLLDIENTNQLFGHPVYGSSWESFAVNQLVSASRGWSPFFYRTAKGDEIDLVLQKGKRMVAVECKASTAPDVPPGFYRALDDLKLKEGYVVSPLPRQKGYRLGPRATAMTVLEMTNLIADWSHS